MLRLRFEVTNDFIGVLKVIQSSNDENNSLEGFAPDNINSQVKVKETNKILLVNQEHLDADIQDLPEEGIGITLVTQTSNNSNGDITLEGQAFLVQKSLITDIKQAINSNPKEIEQATIDDKKVILLFADISFTITLHRFNNSYIPPNEKDEYDSSKPVQIKDTTSALLFALKSNLDADAQDLPDQVMVSLIDLGQPTPTGLKISGGFLMVPKSVIADIKTALNNNPVGSVERDNSTWHLVASFTINLEFIVPSS